ncbi:kinesin protein KIF20A-like [Tropilaelaps mercedesae]|uniref:Kinesin protein KIF20A-like n=1 Tax=Tropilaelaps mercedesae TaxID=418985 RepID=A0A1V9XDD7_9ACAR|nr:kinesin protein KIF20A-like [Tropilaelaps mercedesae]
MDSSSLAAAPCRIDFGTSDRERESLPVYLRIKPIEGEDLSIKVIDATTIETNHAGRSNKKATFTHIFSGLVSQEEVFEVTTSPLVQKFLDGANVMSFAYGVTSSGKTYTIMGNQSNPGIVPLTLEKIFGSYKNKIDCSTLTYKPTMFETVQELTPNEIQELEQAKRLLLAKGKGCPAGFEQYTFANITQDTSDSRSCFTTGADSCSVWISVYEIYNEVITDLLDAGPRNKRKGLLIGQDPKGRTYIKDLVQLPVSSAAEAFGLLQVAKQNLAKASTKLNDASSRSHMVFTVKMVQWGAAIVEPLVNQFVVSDLAGSERQGKTGTSGVILKQASAINSSLLVLGRCLEALRKKDKGISAPFRDSKLTRMLNPFFTHGGYVSLIICINPHMHLQDETMDTIRFSAIASEIVQTSDRPLERLRQLRRLTQGCVENSPLKVGQTDDSYVESWQDAVQRKTVRQGISYLEVKASYFNDMARDILRAEKMLMSNDEEIARLKERVKQEEESKQNIRYMFQDKLKEQRDKFLKEKASMREMYEEDKQVTVEELMEEIQTYKNKYIKYREGYAKASEYLKQRLWPELYMFRERFGCLPEFPAAEGTDDTDEDEKSRPENTIRYWQNKLQEKNDEFRVMRNNAQRAAENAAQLTEDLAELQRMRETAENESKEIEATLKTQIFLNEQMEDQIRSLKAELADKETLVDQVAELKRSAQDAEDDHECFVVKSRILMNTLQAELEAIKAELREKGNDLEEASKKEKLAAQQICALQSAVARLEGQIASKSGELSLLKQINAEKALVSEQLATLKKELQSSHEQLMSAQSEMVAMQEKMEEVFEREKELAEREEQVVARLRELRKSHITQLANIQSIEEIRNLRETLSQQFEDLVKAAAVNQAQEAELEHLREKAEAFEVLACQLEKVSEENREFRDRVRSLEGENRRLDEEVKRTRALEVEVEFLTHKLDNQQRRVLRDCPQTEKPIRRRSVSASEADDGCVGRTLMRNMLKSEKPRRRLRLGDEENILDKTLDGTIRDPSPLPTPYRTRSSKRR